MQGSWLLMIMKSVSNNYFKLLCNINFNIDVEFKYYLIEIVNKL